MFEMAHKRAPFTDNEFARKQTISSTLLIKPSLPNELKKINKMCLKKDPTQRPEASELRELIRRFKV